MKFSARQWLIVGWCGAVIIFAPILVLASSGVIDSVSKYAWGNHIGWINFGPTQGSVVVSDSALTGYVWSTNFGWIKLNPTHGGVLNDGNGNLSGYAWGENLGWINFSGVTINPSTGVFSGTASGTVVGEINFSCANCSVKTSWRPTVADTTTPPGGGDGPGPTDTGPGDANSYFRVYINNDETQIDSRAVTVSLQTNASDVYSVWVSNSADFVGGEQIMYIPINNTMSVSWILSDGNGTKYVYTKFCTQSGRCSNVVSDNIWYYSAPVEPETEVPPTGSGDSPSTPPENITTTTTVVKEEPTIIEDIIEAAKRIIKEVVFSDIIGVISNRPRPALEKSLPKQAPLALNTQWNLMGFSSIRLFVFAPLPDDIQMLVQKIPGMQATFNRLGIKYVSDIFKLQNVDLNIPGLTNIVLPNIALSGVSIGGGNLISPGSLSLSKFSLPKGLLLSQLSVKEKSNLPTEFVFARAVSELVDFGSVLTLNSQGKAEERISTIAGKPIHLVVKPISAAKSVTGYLVYKSKRDNSISENFSLRQFLAEIFLTNPVVAAPLIKEIKVEERLVLAEFQYEDTDKDGIYTADIKAPVVEGEYEVITVIDYMDPKLGRRQIRLITVVDPEGYVYEKINGREAWIAGAEVTLYWRNPQTGNFEIWPADEYQQDNPQPTTGHGSYSFLVPAGEYYLAASAPGYNVYQGKPFRVVEGNGIHENIELKVRFASWRAVDWKTIALILVIILLIFNFYRDRIRGRKKA
jgi:hypothetical protein